MMQALSYLRNVQSECKQSKSAVLRLCAEMQVATESEGGNLDTRSLQYDSSTWIIRCSAHVTYSAWKHSVSSSRKAFGCFKLHSSLHVSAIQQEWLQFHDDKRLRFLLRFDLFHGLSRDMATNQVQLRHRCRLGVCQIYRRLERRLSEIHLIWFDIVKIQKISFEWARQDGVCRTSARSLYRSRCDHLTKVQEF